MAKTKLTQEDIKRAVELKASGVSFRELGRMFNVSDTAIYKRLLDLSTQYGIHGLTSKERFARLNSILKG